MVLRQNGDTVRSDLVGGITIGSDPVGTDDDYVDALFTHELPSHVVADRSDVDAGALQFPGGQPGALQQGPRFVGIDVRSQTALEGDINRRQGSAEIAGRQGAGVTVGENVKRLFG